MMDFEHCCNGNTFHIEKASMSTKMGNIHEHFTVMGTPLRDWHHEHVSTELNMANFVGPSIIRLFRMYDAQSRSRSNRSGSPFSSRFWFDLKFSEGHHVVSYLFSFLLVQIFAVDHMFFLLDKNMIIHWCLNLHFCCWFITCLLITGRLTVDSSTMLHPPICRKHKFWWKSPMFDCWGPLRGFLHTKRCWRSMLFGSPFAEIPWDSQK